MIVWGGGVNARAARYDPATNAAWTLYIDAERAVGAAAATPRPCGRGPEMICVWGGPDNTMARYNPATDTWRPISTLRSTRRRHLCGGLDGASS